MIVTKIKNNYIIGHLTNADLNLLDDFNERLFLHDTFYLPNKSGEFIQRSLRSALDILKHGGSVTPAYKDRIFRVHYDNCRIMEDHCSIANMRN